MTTIQTDGTTSRRAFLQQAAAVSLGFMGLSSASARAGGSGVAMYHDPVAGYGPLRPDRLGLFDLPPGFSYHVFSRTGERMDDGLFVPAKHDGMAAFPGPDGLTLIVRNHEIEPAHKALGAFGRRDELLTSAHMSRLYDTANGSPCRGGTVTIAYDTRRGAEEGAVVSQHLSLGGTVRNCAGGPTPWNSWITCEETAVRAGDDDHYERDHGWNFEVPAEREIGIVEPVPLKAMGRFRHEAVAVNPYNGIVYQTEDLGDGLLYRYIPDAPGRLAEGGRLQALRVLGQWQCDTRNWDDPKGFPLRERMPVAWVDVEDVESPGDDLRYQGWENGCARFARAEGMWYGRGAVYIACTNGGSKRLGQIWRYIPPSPDVEGTPAEMDIPGELELVLESHDPGVVENADNITVAPWGDLIVCEDGSGDQRLLGVTPAGKVYVLGRNAMNDYELAGACFSPDGSTLFVNLQTPGMTLAIRGPWREARSW